jgi:hypothetical protein
MFKLKSHMCRGAVLGTGLTLASTPVWAAAVDISAEVATFVADAGTYFGYVLVGIFALAGFGLAIRMIRKMGRA